MNRKEKPGRRRGQSTRQLMGIDRLTPHGIQTPKGEHVFFLVQPDNLSVLPVEGVRGRIRALAELLRGTQDAVLRALDSRESYSQNQSWYRQRQKDEDNPALRELLRRDREHLDEIQTLTASTREFLLAFPMPKEGCENPEVWITRTAKSIADYGFRVRTAEEKDMRRLLSVYYRQDAAAEAEEMYEEGERA